jgi:hypothetical protein
MRRQFFVTPYGRGQWVSLWADGAVDWKAVTDLVDRSYRLVAQKRMIAALEDSNRRRVPAVRGAPAGEAQSFTRRGAPRPARFWSRDVLG